MDVGLAIALIALAGTLGNGFLTFWNNRKTGQVDEATKLRDSADLLRDKIDRIGQQKDDRINFLEGCLDELWAYVYALEAAASRLENGNRARFFEFIAQSNAKRPPRYVQPQQKGQ